MERLEQRFMGENRVVHCSYTGKLMDSPEKQNCIANSAAYHLRSVKRGIETNEPGEDC